MYSIGIDSGSTSTQYVVLDSNGELLYENVLPTGWSSTDVAQKAKEDLKQKGYDVEKSLCVATGYGRTSVPYADKIVTEITCHGKGAAFLFGSEPATIIDIGGQDTKVIAIDGGIVQDFIMNDKCSAGTGRFLEIMANTLDLDPASLCEFAQQGKDVTISSMCTVFAESEVISLIGKGVSKADIAYGIVDSIASKVQSQCGKLERKGSYYLTGGLCECPYMIQCLSAKLSTQVKTCVQGRYAGAIGAALCAQKLKTEKEVSFHE